MIARRAIAIVFWGISVIALSAPGRAIADASIYYSEPESTYGWCAGGRRGTLDSCAEKWCKNNGSQCRLVVSCGSGSGAIARAQKPASGIAMICGAPGADIARALAFTLCMVEANVPCRTETAFDRRGSKLSAEKNQVFDLTFFAQTMLQALRIPGAGATDGEYGPKTRAAITAFQERMGLQADGAVSLEVVSVLIDAVGGTAVLIGKLDRALREVWTRDAPIRPGTSFVHIVSPQPRKDFNAATEGLHETQRLTRLARMIRGRNFPCTVPARSAKLANGKWHVECAERRYELERTSEGVTVSFFAGDQGGPEGSQRPIPSENSTSEGFLTLLLHPLLKSYGEDWSEGEELQQAIDSMRERTGDAYLKACRESEKKFDFLVSSEAPPIRLRTLYHTVDTEAAIIREMPLLKGETREQLIARAVQINIDCAFLANYEKRPWAALMFSSIAAEFVPYAGLFPSLILSSGDLGVTDYGRVRRYVERASKDQQSKWAQTALLLFDGPTKQ